MADKKYVEIANIGVSETFDGKYKSTVPAMVKSTIQAAINKSSKLTTTTKSPTGFYVDGSVVLKKTCKDKQMTVEAKITMQLATWPQKSMFAMPNGSAKIQTDVSDKIDDVVKDAITAMLKPVLPKVVPELEKRA